MRLLAVDDNCSLRGEILKKAIQDDLEKGFIPCYVVATLGTTGTCAFDNIDEIGPICKEYNIWLHIDAAYAGNLSLSYQLYISVLYIFDITLLPIIVKILLVLDLCCLINRRLRF